MIQIWLAFFGLRMYVAVYVVSSSVFSALVSSRRTSSVLFTMPRFSFKAKNRSAKTPNKSTRTQTPTKTNTHLTYEYNHRQNNTLLLYNAILSELNRTFFWNSLLEIFLSASSLYIEGEGRNVEKNSFWNYIDTNLSRHVNNGV